VDGLFPNYIKSGKIAHIFLYSAAMNGQFIGIETERKFSEAGLKILNKLLVVAAMAVLAACDPGAFAVSPSAKRPVDVASLPTMRVVGLSVVVPESLSVSEADGYKPAADILWREDPFGDRYIQVKKILTDGITRGAGKLQGDLPVVLHVELMRFHAVTERTRYAFVGEHEIEFMLSVTNARTGDVIVPFYRVDATFGAYGGAQALEAEHKGITQKVRILNQLDAVIRQELTGTPAEPGK